MTSESSAMLRPVKLSPDGRVLHLLDQRSLPEREDWLDLDDVEAVAEAIEKLAVRGAPAIGCAAALGLVASSWRFSDDAGMFRESCLMAFERLARTRPTAVNLFHAIGHMRGALVECPAGLTVAGVRGHLHAAALRYVDDELRACLTMADHGAPLLPDVGTVLTHCNTGALATAGWGTALGVIRRAHANGKKLRVLADETRPVLQGARLTAWELRHDGIPVDIIADNMAGALMARGEVQAAIVGADRIARNGDVANKIGTYTVAVLCRYHQIPFYVAAPWSTVDPATASGAEIPIEERDHNEVHLHGGRRMTPAGVGARNPAFDVTPAELVTAFITERGVFRPATLSALMDS
ncbi:S-methyl-5-thioribose-1-phosphate isomerase [Nannocystis bainbridge]|uniref:Methylthioribose-1-phosphate isomerase n=1 Tax=Nannocystis bainbridge TaxID=2995303 RepID=A0ABT5DTF5_9BACT|nr:S-methyl-5-thioribose-1-phosphate isomerase [Nannocystis bainbridge]MDC0716924.1 S-methyl-5-thioribose-1-phosphate isomerase [Nannocystis bainbridge]